MSDCQIIVVKDSLFFHLFEVHWAHFHSEVQLPLVLPILFLEVAQQSIESVFDLRDEDGVDGERRKYNSLTWNCS